MNAQLSQQPIFVADLINEYVPTVRPGQTSDRVFHLMDEVNLTQLPVVDKDKFIGLVLDSALLERELAVGTEKLLPIEYNEAFVRSDQHIYDVLKIAGDHQLEVVAVVDTKGNYSGAITMRDMAVVLSRMLATHVPGGILILETDAVQYSMAEIARIAEGDNFRILSSYAENRVDSPDKMRITLKINKADLTALAASFERFNYSVVALFHESTIDDRNADRLDLLLKYLDM